MKTIVVNEREHTRVPFLRGILTRSLLEAGLPFEQAFDLASTVRDALAETAEVRSDELRRQVALLLEARGEQDVLEHYRYPAAAPASIQVRSSSGRVSAFSRARHERFLQSSGMRADKAEHSTAMVYDQLLAAGVAAIPARKLGFLTYRCLRQEVSRKAAHRYLVWTAFQRTGRPLLLLICGAVGTGKSTIASEIAHLLEIVRIQSTDMLREVMRMMLPRRLLPVLHTSSFSAWETLPLRDMRDRNQDQLIAEGFRSQVDLLAVPCEAVLLRAIEESVPLILEGVHAHPQLLERVPRDSDAIAVHVTLAVLKTTDLQSRLVGRGKEIPQRRSSRYLNNFDAIWSLQSFLLSEADRCDVPIITNEEKDRSVQQVIQQINHELEKHFDASVQAVFGDVVDELGDGVRKLEWQELVPLVGREPIG